MGATESSTRQPRLVGEFALASLVAFLAVGLALAEVISNQLVAREEGVAEFHAQFVVDQMLRYHLPFADLDAGGPLPTADRSKLDSYVTGRILKGPVKRVKLWASDGTILYSDEPRLIGRRFRVDEGLETAFSGRVFKEISDLQEPENVYERGIASKLLATYVPVYPPGAPQRGRPVAVLELYQDYASVHQQVGQAFRSVALAVAIGLIGLYVALLPILRRVSRRMSEQNVALEAQAERLSELLASEQQRVAELRRLNQMKSDFVAVASHELRTPLTTILGYARTLARPEFADDPEVRREFVRAVEGSGQRLHRLINNLLASAHLEDHPVPVSLRPFDVGHLLDEVASTFDSGSDRVRVSRPDEPAEIWSDREQLGMVLSNLIDNGLKYSPEEEPVDVSAALDDGTLRITVRDRGIGVDPSEHERIFERFYQADQSTTRRYGGVGLGLHVVREGVASLGGRISVESSPNTGSTFTVEVPVTREEPPRPIREENPFPSATSV